MEIRNHPDAVPFSARYPVISKNIGHYDVKDIIMKRGDEQLRKTNVKAHMTQWFMHKKDPTFAKIADQAVALAIENSPHKVSLEPFDCWGNIYRKGDYTKSHDHWPHPWSWVYYANVSDSCSGLRFDDDGFRFIPDPGDLILFPGWLYHSVEPQTTDYERVVVAGNIKLTK